MPLTQGVIGVSHPAGPLNYGMMFANQWFNGVNNSSAATEVFLVGREKVADSLQSTFIRFDLNSLTAPPPLGAHIIECTLRIQASATESTELDLLASIPAKEGLWSIPLIAGPGVSDVADAADMQVSDSGGVIIDVAGLATAEAGLRTTLVARWQSGGQTVEAPSTFTLDSCAFVLDRIGTEPASPITIKVFAAAANDGSDDQPVEPELAESDSIAFDSVPPHTSEARITFNFSGPDQITLTSGNRYTFLVCPANSPDGINWINLHFRATASADHTNGALIQGAPESIPSTFDTQGGAFGGPPFPVAGDMPLHLEQDGITVVHPPPVGPVIPITAPDFTLGAWAEFTGLAPLLQAWVNDPATHALDRFALLLSTPDQAAGVKEREGDDAQLRVSWIDTQSHTVVGV